MASEFEPLEDLADAILLGNPVDWASAESSAGAVNREAVRQLKILARIAELHRNLAYDIPSEAPPKLERWDGSSSSNASGAAPLARSTAPGTRSSTAR